MMVAPVDALFALGVPIGFVLCVLGYYALRTWNTPGIGAFTAFVVILGLGSLVAAVTELFAPPIVNTGEAALPLWAQLAMLSWALSTIPWFLFALQYTGRYTRLRWRTIGLLFLPFVGITINLGLEFVGVGSLVLLSIIGTIVFIYCLALVVIGVALVVRATHRYEHLSVAYGGLLSAAPVGLFLALNSLGVVGERELLSAAVYVAGFGFAASTLGLALVRYEMFDVTPAVGVIGERTITQQTDDLVLVVDDRGRVVKCNERATETLGCDRQTALGKPVTVLLGYSTEELDRRETVTLETGDGSRRYDSQVHPIEDAYDRELGALVSLHDVTEHEIREQRLAVLNRVLRHNLRNKVEVVKSHAEILDETYENGHAATISETADKIVDLGHSARTIDKFVSHSARNVEVDIVAAIESALTAVGGERDGVSLSRDLPASATVETNNEALYGALESALDNALTYADSTVEIRLEDRQERYEIAISDDGPGIPESELDCLNAGTETALQHGTGLGLWQLKWAVTTMGGELAFDTSDGTTVTFTVPDHRAVETTQVP